MPTTAAALIIGDEILSGKFTDKNSPFIIRRCQELGLDLRHISIVPDELDDIAFDVSRWSDRVDYVFTTGGVGPTHDDLTMPGIAQAFGVPLVRSAELMQIIREKFEGRLNEDVFRMADIPMGAELWEEGALFFPQVVVRNVIIFPGVPRLFHKKFDGIAHRLTGGATMLSVRLLTGEPETEIAGRLRDIASRHPHVAIGSYPQFDEKPWTVTITIDSLAPLALDAAEAELREAIDLSPPGQNSET
jgi:molybdenum cofactor synthesis domain-containing protein